jgi:hypothetical protein
MRRDARWELTSEVALVVGADDGRWRNFLGLTMGETHGEGEFFEFLRWGKIGGGGGGGRRLEVVMADGEIITIQPRP